MENLGLVFQVVSRVLCKRFLGSVASLGGAGSALIGCLGVQTQTTLVQMAPLRTGHHYLCGGLVFAILPWDVEALLTERGIPVDHTTIWRWVQCYAPELNKRCRRELKPTNGSWRVDETYIRVKGKWVYLYRAVDSTGHCD